MIYGVIKENVFEVMFAFPIPQNLKELNPLKALELFATEFGLKFQIGHKKGKFMYHDAFWSDSDQIKIIDSESSDKSFTSFFVKIEPHGSKSRIEVHTAFALNINKYESWLAKQMSTMIIQPGTVTFWIDPEKNPKAFSEGINYHWVTFGLGTEQCTIASEGTNLVATMNAGTDRELIIFSVIPPVDQNVKHMVAVTFDSTTLCLYFDAELLHSLNITDFI